MICGILAPRYSAALVYPSICAPIACFTGLPPLSCLTVQAPNCHASTQPRVPAAHVPKIASALRARTACAVGRFSIRGERESRREVVEYFLLALDLDERREATLGRRRGGRRGCVGSAEVELSADNKEARLWRCWARLL